MCMYTHVQLNFVIDPPWNANSDVNLIQRGD